MAWVLVFGLTCLYLGFSRGKYANVVFGILAGGSFVVVGYGFLTELVYVGFGSYNVIVYNLMANSYLAAGHTAIGGMFALAGVVLILFAVLIAIFGDSQEEPGDIVEGVGRSERH